MLVSWKNNLDSYGALFVRLFTHFNAIRFQKTNQLWDLTEKLREIEEMNAEDAKGLLSLACAKLLWIILLTENTSSFIAYLNQC